MAIKDKNKAAQETQEVIQQAAQEQAQDAAQVASDAGTGADTGTGEDKTKSNKRGGPRGRRGPRKVEWSNEMQAAIAGILKTPKAAGTLRTPAAVAMALNSDPAFLAALEGSNPGVKELKPQHIPAFIDWVTANLTSRNMAVPEWLTVDSGEFKPVLELFTA